MQQFFVEVQHSDFVGHFIGGKNDFEMFKFDERAIIPKY
jgi:hypothetical protein